MARNLKTQQSSQYKVDRRDSPKINKSLLVLVLDPCQKETRKYDIVNLLVDNETDNLSLENKNSQKQSVLSAFKDEPQVSRYVERKSGNPESEIELKLVPLEAHLGQQAATWCQYFSKTIAGYYLPTATLLYVLKSLQIPKVQELLATATTLDQAIDIIETYYGQIYDKEVTTPPRQQDFVFMQDYKDNVDEYIRVQSLNKKVKGEALETLTYDTFIGGLSLVTKIHFVDKPKMNIPDYVQHVRALELMIITAARNYKQLKQDLGQYTETTPAAKPIHTHSNVQENYCEIHQTTGHSTKECSRLKWFQNRIGAPSRTRGEKKHFEKKSFVLQKPNNSSTKDETKK
ncbi:uncharacterized protein NEMAJ01_0463 [Nematocida major]|uniref:uncharacterized protein n=1 Tax=Nematocida major TaxID=1912982 RepID=UPI0020079F82|nr:uncharacterized protein NEMAJ01_0463 [Nematocida major]KAH9385567.1 hypothetical protein NEMAJ01_0463 [Nematocida major]